MCRFLCYLGPPVLMADLLHRPTHSLILQSYKARERKEPLNGDGFGVGWYTPDIAPTPCVFTSITPAWSNQNLRRLADHVRSPCFFAHVRAASPGMSVSEQNCHPFQSGPYLWMHNGFIEDFARIKRRLREALPDSLYDAIEGTTDSEHAFALFLSLLGEIERPRSAADLGRTLAATVVTLERWRTEAGIAGPSYLNFAVTDGRSMATLRYVSDPRLEPISLYLAVGRKYECTDGVSRLAPAPEGERAVVIASEPFTTARAGWRRVPPNHVVTVESDLTVTVGLMKPPAPSRASERPSGVP